MNQNFFFFFFFVFTLNLLYYLPNLLATPIVGGYEDWSFSFKMHVSIHRRNLETHQYEYFCGGSVIRPIYILTAANCFMMKEENAITDSMNFAQSQPKIIAGTNKRDGHGTEEIIVKVFIPNIFNFAPKTYADIAVAKLNADIDIGQNINVAPLGLLPPYEEIHRPAVFCGFGIYKLRKGSDGILRPAQHFSKINLYLAVRITSRVECSNFHSVICAVDIAAHLEEIRTSCTGDSGAGLLYNNEIVGVLSHGPPDCNSNTDPIVFTDLSEFNDYVDNAMNEDDDHSNMHVISIESPLHPSLSHRAGPSHSPGSLSDRSSDRSPPQSPIPARKSAISKFVSKAKKVFSSKH